MMASNSGSNEHSQARTTTTSSPNLQADDPTALDGRDRFDYSFIFKAREACITFPLHRQMGGYKKYGRLLAV